MLTALSIPDIVLIEAQDLEFGGGLAVMTGETGAGKSIMLDSLGLVLGQRADAGLVRQGAAQGVVSARFDIAADHTVDRKSTRLTSSHQLAPRTTASPGNKK